MRDGLLRQPNRTKLRCHNLANEKANTKTQSQFEKNENDDSLPSTLLFFRYL